ncbi:MAG: PAS domain S-box protein [Ardenticatenaceae bacterium]
MTTILSRQKISANRPITILIVDDNRMQREYLAALLSYQGYKLVLANSGFSALTQAAELMPDLILLDVMMPGMNGFEVCQALRADPVLAETPIIMVTSLDDRTSRLRGLEAGADDFVVKPFDHLELRARISSLTRLNRQRQLRQLELEEALEELRQSEEKFSNLFHYSNDAIFIHDLEGQILDVNQKVLSQFGYTRAEILSSQIFALHPPEALQAFREAFEHIYCNGFVKFEIEFKKKNGETFPAEVSASLFEIAGKNVVQEMVRDITERKRAEQKLSSVLNTVGEGIITIDSASTIVMVNQEVQNIFGYQQEELINQKLQILMPKEYRQTHQAAMKRYLHTGIGELLGQRIEMEGLRKDGSIFPLEIHLAETKIGERLFFTAAVRDITERHELNKMRDNFVSTVSHELRTPLASVMGFTETILGERPGPLTRLQRRFLENSYKSSERLLKLIEELLTVSRIQQGSLRLHKRPFWPPEAIQNVKEMLISIANSKSVQLSLDNQWPIAEEFIGDRDRLEQVVTNLIGNAIKFTPEGQRVWVESYKTDDFWHFQVCDEGIGIPESDLPHLFERFYRASNATEAQIQGTGLGLYICKAIISEHSGQIGLDSEVGVGTTAWFRLPVSK